MARSTLARLRRRLRPPSKGDAEMRYWSDRAAREGVLGNGHYEHVFTTQFGLDQGFFDAKRVLDVGCGPRGSLEWAAGAARRVGLDPLVERYRALGIDGHAMEYVAAPAERMPFADASFDVVATLNSLDHVDDVDAAVAEVTRVAAPGATWLLIVEVAHEPTATEPQSLAWDVADDVAGWTLQWSARNGLRPDHDIYASIDDDVVQTGDGPGLLRARLTRSAS